MHTIFTEISEKYNTQFSYEKDIWYNGSAYFPLYNYCCVFETGSIQFDLKCEYRQSDFSRKRKVLFNALPTESCTLQINAYFNCPVQTARFSCRKRNLWDFILRRSAWSEKGVICLSKDADLVEFLQQNKLLKDIFHPSNFYRYSSPYINGYFHKKKQSYTIETAYMLEIDDKEIIEHTISLFHAIASFLME